MSMVTSFSKLYARSPILAAWLFLVLVFTAALLFPVRYSQTRLLLIVLPPILWVGALYLFGRRRVVRNTCLAIVGATAIFLIFLALPGRSPDTARLRQEYVRSLRAYEGTVYVWGGETRLGIDCSGLIRCALIDTDLREGIRTLNPALLREGVSQWWHDASAQALGEGYRNRTHLLFSADSLNHADYSRLQPGDIAVTESGVHTLAYIGDHTWIQADPGAWRVIRTRVPSKDGWFIQDVNLLRWRQFE